MPIKRRRRVVALALSLAAAAMLAAPSVRAGVGQSIADVGDAAKSTQHSLTEGVRLGAEQVLLEKKFLYAAGALGALLTIALLLLIVLEIQWIRYWGRRLAAAK